MDYDYVIGRSNGKDVIIHELFHGLGAPHTTDGNARCDDSLSDGLLLYKDLKYFNNRNSDGKCIVITKSAVESELALDSRNGLYDFQIYLDNNQYYLGSKNQGGVTWDTRTLMYQIAEGGMPLFVTNNNGTGFNNTYSKILSTYYDTFVKE